MTTLIYSNSVVTLSQESEVSGNCFPSSLKQYFFRRQWSHCSLLLTEFATFYGVLRFISVFTPLVPSRVTLIQFTLSHVISGVSISISPIHLYLGHTSGLLINSSQAHLKSSRSVLHAQPFNLLQFHHLKNTPWEVNSLYKVVQIWPGQTVTCLHTISPGHIWTTL